MTQADEHENIETQKPTKPDGDKAFHLADDMDNDLLGIDNLVCALKMIASGIEEARESSALYGIANGIAIHANLAREEQSEISHLTWGYAHPDEVRDDTTG
jgi:hypothetical protein